MKRKVAVDRNIIGFLAIVIEVGDQSCLFVALVINIASISQAQGCLGRLLKLDRWSFIIYDFILNGLGERLTS